MKALLDDNAMAVAYGVHPDPEKGREVLACVKIEDGEISSADGFMLVRRPIWTEGKGSFLLRGTTCLKAKILVKPNKCVIEYESGTITIQPEDKKVTARVIDKLAHRHRQDVPDITIVDNPVKGRFPNYEGLYPESDSYSHIAFTVNVLKGLLKAIGNEDTIEFKIREGENTPVEFVAGSAHGLIMPRRVLKENKYWHKGGKK